MRPVRLAATVVAATTALTLTACSGGGSDGPARSGRNKTPKFSAQDINPQPRDKIRQGGTYRRSIQQWIRQYNPYQVDGTEGDGTDITDKVLPELFTSDASGRPHRNTDFLAKATVRHDHGRQTVLYDLNPEAKWSDGKSLSWKDFHAQWKALNGHNRDFTVADSSGYDQIADVARGADDHQVRVTFKAAYADWQRLFKPLLPAVAISTPQEFNKGWIEKIPVTANAWKLGKLDRSSQSVTLVRDPAWWGARPKLDRIVYRALSDDAALNAYLNHEIDEVSATTTEAYQRLKKDKGTDIRVGARWDEVHLTLNGGHGPLKDVRVRRAVQTAVSNKALSDIASKGMPFHAPELGNHFFMPNQAGYRDNSGAYGSGDTGAADKLLDRAGWKSPGNGKTRNKDGKTLTLRFVMTSDATGQTTDQAAAVQHMLKQAGIDMRIQKVPANDFFEKYVNRGNFDLTSFRNVDESFTSKLFPVFQMTHGDNLVQNYGKVSSPRIQKLLKQAGGELDATKSRALYNKADKLIWDAGHSLEYYQRPQVIAVRKNVANYGAPGLGSEDWLKVGFTK